MAESLWKPQIEFYEDTQHDRNNGSREWSFADIDELRLHCETGGAVESAATLLYRAYEDVRQKAIELGLIN